MKYGLKAEIAAKAIVASAFRNGPLEAIHFDRISQDEMKELMKYAVDRVYWFLTLHDRSARDFWLFVGWEWFNYAQRWDPPSPLPKMDAALEMLKEEIMSARTPP